MRVTSGLCRFMASTHAHKQRCPRALWSVVDVSVVQSRNPFHPHPLLPRRLIYTGSHQLRNNTDNKPGHMVPVSRGYLPETDEVSSGKLNSSLALPLSADRKPSDDADRGRPLAGALFATATSYAPLIPAGHLNFKSAGMEARPPFQPLRREPTSAPAPCDISLKCLPNAQLELIRLLASLFGDLSRPTSASQPNPTPPGVTYLSIVVNDSRPGYMCRRRVRRFFIIFIASFLLLVQFASEPIKGSGVVIARALCGEGSIKCYYIRFSKLHDQRSRNVWINSPSCHHSVVKSQSPSATVASINEVLANFNE